MDSSSALPEMMSSSITPPSKQKDTDRSHEGEAVEFAVTKGPKGLQAESVKKL